MLNTYIKNAFKRNLIKKIVSALLCAGVLYGNTTHAFVFTVNDDRDTGVDSDIPDNLGSTIRKVSHAIIWLYQNNGLDQNNNPITPQSLIARFPGLSVDLNSPASLGYPQQVKFTKSNIGITGTPIHFGSRANIFFDGGTDYRGAGVKLLGGGSNRLFVVASEDNLATPTVIEGVNLFFRGFTFRNGNANSPGSLSDPTAPGGSGGAFLIQKGNVSFKACAFTDNRATQGGAIRNDTGRVRIYDSEFTYNGPPNSVGDNLTLDNNGGAISTGGGLLEIYGQAPIGFGADLRIRQAPVLKSPIGDQ